ncbi:3-deoxy-manno-octulosonate cytidylyltransferase [Fusobacterium perfoetens]|uniref:3-deoxy-manno-octulosonate cytidylyltransferase n=1 Tax=Fusobacterium perfoetens TaxID=852 RepID=UPI0026F1F672|nr:3-deoxy-manno-octulosonate cytidylyltransferase [Fusobacterium perfoetens]
MNIIGVIPARYQSSRLPGKPLADILGKPMIWWVYHRAKKVTCLNNVIVATDDQRIVEVCNKFHIPVVMTSKEHRNGSERLSEIASKIEADIYVTIQGDEPLLEKTTIEKVVETILANDNIQCATLKTAYHNPVDVINGTTPKVVTDLNNDILLFTRSAVPYPKAAIDYIIYKPIGVYAFRRDILLKYGKLEMGPLEKAEEIELLRLVEHGYKIRIAEVDSETIAVDTYKDLERIRQYLMNHPEYQIN